MKRRNWDCCKNSVLPALSRLKLFLFVAWMVFAHDAIAQALTVLSKADYAITESSILPTVDLSWSKVTLPHRSARPAWQEMTGYWYRLRFDAQNVEEPLWLLFPKLRSGGTIYLNGLMIGKISEADLQTQRRWFRPYMFVVPPFALRAAGNEILVHFAIREPLTSFGEVLFGPEQQIRSMHDRLMFWENSVTEVASILCLIVGSLTLLIWARRR